MWLAEAVVGLLVGYAALGALFAIPFALRGVQQVDPAAAGSGWGFRLIITPGVIGLWPLLLWRWVRGGGPPEERSAHRQAAR